VQCAKRIVMRNTRTCDMLRHGVSPGCGKRILVRKLKDRDKRYAEGRLQIPLVKIDESDSQELVKIVEDDELTHDDDGVHCE
jgi:hypothetical protein